MSVSDAAVLAAMDTLARHALFLKPEEMRLALEAAEPFLVERERETRGNANACTLRVEAERDALRAQLDAERGLRQATRTALGGLVVTLAAERDAARADVDALLEAIAAVERGNVSHVAWTKANAALYDTANEIAAKRGDAS